MKRYLTLFALLPLVAFSQVTVTNFTVGRVTRATPPVSGCTNIFASQVQTEDEATDASGLVSQKIQNGSGVTVCKVDVKLNTWPSAAGGDIYVQLRSAENGGGTLYGTSSTNSIPGSNAGGFYSFTFASPPAIPGDFFITVRTIGAAEVFVLSKFDAASYGGTDYGRYTGAVDNRNTADVCFKVYE